MFAITAIPCTAPMRFVGLRCTLLARVLCLSNNGCGLVAAWLGVHLQGTKSSTKDPSQQRRYVCMYVVLSFRARDQYEWMDGWVVFRVAAFGGSFG